MVWMCWFTRKVPTARKSPFLKALELFHETMKNRIPMK